MRRQAFAEFSDEPFTFLFAMTSSKPSTRACLALVGLVVVEIALPAPWLRQLGDCVNDGATDRRRQNGLAGLEARLRESNLRHQIGNRNTASGYVIDVVRDEAEIFLAHRDPLAIGSVFRDAVRTSEHDRAPVENEEPPGSSTTPAPSFPNIKGAFARGWAPERMDGPAG